MSFWDTVNGLLNSNAFKSIMPMQALTQEATKGITGIDPAHQYAIGAGIGTGIAGLGALGAGAGSSYLPASAPNMGMAGSTLGPGGLFSPLNPMGTGMASSGSGNVPSILQLMRSMPSQSQQQPPDQQRKDQESRIRLIYQMFPHLRPGSSLSGGLNG